MLLWPSFRMPRGKCGRREHPAQEGGRELLGCRAAKKQAGLPLE